jgi:hypothetical protein
MGHMNKYLVFTLCIAQQETSKSLKVPVPFGVETLKKEYEKSLLFSLLLVIGNIVDEELAEETSLDGFIEALRDLAKSGTV